MRHEILFDAKTREALNAAARGTGRVSLNAKILLLSCPEELRLRPLVSCKEIAESLGVCAGRVSRVRRLFVIEGLEGVLRKTPRRKAPKRWKADERFDCELANLLREKAPGGRGRWSLRELAAQMVERGVVESVSYETIRAAMKRLNLVEKGAA
jgi:transposase